MQILNILPQQIYKFECGKLLIEKTLTNLKNEQFSLDRENWQVNQTYNVRLNKDSKYNDLHHWVRKCLNTVKDELQLQCNRLEITSSWGNVSDKNQWHWTHSHPNSLVSAILYLTDSNACTWFSVDNFWSSDSVIKLKQDHQVIHKQPTVSGDLLIFPSSLVHSVDQHQGNQKRYTLSFNAFPCGEIGFPEESAGIILNVL